MWQAIVIICVQSGSSVDCSDVVVEFRDSGEACHMAALARAREMISAINSAGAGNYAGMMVGCKYTTAEAGT